VTSWLERALALCAVAAAMVFIAVGIARPVWLDEANSVLIAQHSFAGIVDALSRDNNFPLYYFLLSVWMRVFGDSEIALRALSAVFYLGGCAAVYALGRRLAGQSRAGWYAALFYEASALAIRQAQNVRMYSLLGMLSGLSAWCWLRVFRDRDRSRAAWACLLAVDTLGMLTHAWFVFVLAGQFAATAIFERRQIGRFVLAGAAPAALFGVLWGPVLRSQLHNGATAWMPHFQPGFVLIAATEFYGPLATLVLIALAAAAGNKWRSTSPAAVMFAASAALPLAISFVKPIYWPGRYLIVALPPLAAMLGAVLASARLRAPVAAVGILLLAFQVQAQIAARDQMPDARLPSGQSDRTTAQFLLARGQTGDAVVFTSLTRAAADYYFQRAGAAERFREFSFPADTATHMGWMDPAVTDARRAALEAEAASLIAQLRAPVAAGRSVWVYDGYAADVNAILIRHLDEAFGLHQIHVLEGPYHKRILEYRAKARE